MDLQDLKTLLIKHEGLKLKPYTDSVGKVTIGVGHDLTDLGITGSQALDILGDDIGDTIAFLDRNLPWWKSISDARQVALADMAFNLHGRLLGFTSFLEALQGGNFQKAHDEMLNSTWATQVGARAQELAQMILTGK